ncbi:MAG: peptidase dimerization domain-containing protein [bacterium]
MLYTPTFNINGISAGYIGKGGKTVIPSEASVKLDIRLVANQSSEDIFNKLVNYVKRVRLR